MSSVDRGTVPTDFPSTDFPSTDSESPSILDWWVSQMRRHSAPNSGRYTSPRPKSGYQQLWQGWKLTKHLH
ncbi:hypothetical protein B0H10DRAFT_2034472 [Mycena sp. CBHHK59/15]|nr:hypothetical protein B0H10DRAFT_2034472 [Mycena sp. CBHHK59/15]